MGDMEDTATSMAIPTEDMADMASGLLTLARTTFSRTGELPRLTPRLTPRLMLKQVGLNNQPYRHLIDYKLTGFGLGGGYGLGGLGYGGFGGLGGYGLGGLGFGYGNGLLLVLIAIK